jgi:hypothetical protein
MRKLAVCCLLVLLFLPALAWAQTHQVATQRAVSLALMNPWPRLPTPAEITEAFNEYQSRLGKNVTVTSGPTKMNAPWEKDPLSANKVVLTIRADYQSQSSQLMAVVLTYDFQSRRFKFEGVMMEGIKRYPGDKSTASYLEPQDLVYLGKGWISLTGNKRTVALADDVADVVEEYILQFKDTCFGAVVKLGDPAKYRDALSHNLTVITRSSALGKSAKASLISFTTNWAITAPPNELHIPFDIPLNPSDRKLTFDNMQTLYHESTHQIEWIHGDKRDRSDPTADRNTDYLDGLVNALAQWKKYEREVNSGARSPEQAWAMYNSLENTFSNLEQKFKPDLRNLENWAGIHISMEEIRNSYLSSNCGEGLRKLASNYLNRHIVYAMIYDGVTGRPVEGAEFVVLRPGVTTQKWITSRNDPTLVAAKGISNDSGMVVLDQNLIKGNTYSFVVVHDSYKMVRYETLSITATSQNPLKVTVKLSK